MTSPLKSKDTVQWVYCNNIGEIDSYRSLWEEYSSQVNDPFFNSFDWIKHWVTVFWDINDSLHLYIAISNNKCVLFAPFYIKRETTFPYLKTLNLLGQGEKEEYEISSEYQDIYINKDYQYLLLELSQKLTYLNFDKASFKYLLEDCFLIKLASTYKRTLICSIGTRYVYSSNVNSFPILSKNNKSKLKKSTNKLKALDAKYVWVTDKDYDSYWELMKKLHQNRWRSLGKLGAFNHQKFNEFHNLYRKENNKNIRISAITINNEPIAINYYFTYRDTLYFYQSGWNDIKYSNISPGFALHAWSMNNSSEQNYDLMKGEINNSYKKKLGSNVHNKMYNAIFIRSYFKHSLSKLINKILQLKCHLK